MEFPWRLKLRRAEHHLDAFDLACDDYLKAANVGFEYEVDRTTGHVSVRLRADREPPMSLGVVVGDALHNLRSALDSAAWEACSRAGVPEARQRDVQFPIGLRSDGWARLSDSQLPGASREARNVFRSLQPWYAHEVAKVHGVHLDPERAKDHPLARLHDLARIDRHRIPHPVLARAGDTWLGSPEGVRVELEQGDPPPWGPGVVILTWRVTPAARVDEVHPDGRAILAFTNTAALRGRSAGSELRMMWSAVASALRHVEIEVLNVVTSAQLRELDALDRRLREAEDRRDALWAEHRAIDHDYMRLSEELNVEVELHRTAYTTKWRELFD